MEEVSLGKRLEELRKKLGYTQADISSLLGIDQSLLSEYESGKRKVSLSTLEKLEDIYCCDLIHTPSVISPAIQMVFRVNNVTTSSIKAIQAVNRIVLNAIFMSNLLKED